jgi:hypothetical protein
VYKYYGHACNPPVSAQGRGRKSEGRPTALKGHPTISKGCPTLHDFAKYIIQCPTKIKDISYTPQSLAVGQATWYSHKLWDVPVMRGTSHEAGLLYSTRRNYCKGPRSRCMASRGLRLLMYTFKPLPIRLKKVKHLAQMRLE